MTVRYSSSTAFQMISNIHIYPLIVWGHRRFDRRSLWCPDSPQNGLKANTVFIHAPQLDAGLLMGGSHGLDLLGQFFKLLLDRLISLGMLRTRHAGTVPHSLQVVPSSAHVYRTTQALLHPARDFRPTPQPSICRGVLQGLRQFGLLFSGKQGLASCDLMVMILDAFVSPQHSTVG